MGAKWLLSCGAVPDIAARRGGIAPTSTAMARASGWLVKPGGCTPRPPRSQDLWWRQLAGAPAVAGRQAPGGVLLSRLVLVSGAGGAAAEDQHGPIDLPG